MYHYVRPIAASAWPRIKGLEVGLFREQLGYLQRHYTLVGMNDVLAALAGEAPLDSHAGHGAQPQTGLPSAGGGGDKRAIAVMAQQLEAALLFTEGRREEALVLARQAAVVEDSLSFEFGPPLPVKPAHELVGEMLMDLRRPKDAMTEFDAALKRAPRRALSLLGLGRAGMAARDQATARRAYGELQKMWSHADKALPELKEVGSVPPPGSW
jgi:predicted Zn-dependent protease